MLAGLVALGACSLPEDGDDAPPPVDAGFFDTAIPPDAPSLCSACGPNEVCVQVFNGTCGQISLACEERNPACAGPVCSPECQRWQCNDGNEQPFFFCSMATCPLEEPGALHCYGP